MKKSLLALAFAVFATFGMLACSPTPLNPDGSTNVTQQAINAADDSYKGLALAIDSTTAALKANKLKTADARKALDAFEAAKAGLDAGKAVLKGATPPPAPPK